MDRSPFAMALLLYICYLINTLHSMFIYQASRSWLPYQKAQKNYMTILLKNNVFLKAAIIVYSVGLSWILVRERELFSKDVEGIYPRNPYHHGNGSSSKM